MTHHLEPWEPQHLDVVVLFKRSIPFWWYQKVRTYPSTKVLTSNGGSDRLVAATPAMGSREQRGKDIYQTMCKRHFVGGSRKVSKRTAWTGQANRFPRLFHAAAPMKSAKAACFEGTIFPSGNWAAVSVRDGLKSGWPTDQPISSTN